MKQYNNLINVLKEGHIVFDINRKYELRRKSKSFLKKLAKDLNLNEFKIYFNEAGDGSSGEATLIGMWDNSRGIYIYLTDDTFLYRTVSHMEDYLGGCNHFIWSFDNKNFNMTYEEILSNFIKLAA